MEKKEFTVAEGIAYQKDKLARLEFLLKPEIFEYVKEKAIEKNIHAVTGYDICRGSDIDNIVSNYIYNKKIPRHTVEILAKFAEKDGGQEFNFTEYVYNINPNKVLKIAEERFMKQIEKSDMYFVEAILI